MPTSVLSWDEKRSFQRIPANAEVWVRNVAVFSDPSPFHIGTCCTLQDLSFGGVRFLATDNFGQVGDRLEISLPKLHGEMSLVGTIVRRRQTTEGDDIALHFQRLPVTEQMNLTQTLFGLASTLPMRQRNRPLSPLKLSKATPRFGADAH